MNCPSCNSTKLQAHCYGNLDYIIHYYNKKWQMVNPTINTKYINSKAPYTVCCKKCYNTFDLDFTDIDIFQPNLNFNEITLDLDQTLIHGELDVYTQMNPDITFNLGTLTYLIKFRPHLNEFIDFCNFQYSKINIFTAATPEYANEILKHLNIKNIGFIKTRQDTYRDRPLSFEWELMKSMNGQLIVEDKPLVVAGHANVVFKVSPFHYVNKNDTALLDIIPNLNRKKVKRIKDFKKFTTTISFFLRNFKIEATLSLSQLSDIINIQAITKEEMKDYPVFTTPRPSRYETTGSICELSIIDVTYPNYIKIMQILETTPISQDEWDKKLSKKSFLY